MTTDPALYPVIPYAILAGLSFYFYIQHALRPFSAWGVGWVALAGRELLPAGIGTAGIWLDAGLLAAAGAGVLLGAEAYGNWPRRSLWRAALHGLVVGVLTAVLLLLIWATVPGVSAAPAGGVAFLTAASLVGAWIVYGHGRSTSPTGALLAALALSAWGVGVTAVTALTGADTQASWPPAVHAALATALVIGMTILGIEEARARLSRNRVHPRALFDDDPNMILVVQNERCVFSNRALEERTGWELERIKGGDLLELVASRHRDAARAQLLAPGDGGPNTEIELEILDADGRRLPVLVHTHAIEWEGQPALRHELTDITTQRRAEAEIRSINEELQRINAELEKSNQLKTEFLSNTSHELKTPLTSIIANTEILEYEMCGPVNGEQRRVLANISRNSQHLLEMISRLLDFARHEEGHDLLRWERVDLEVLLDGVVETVRPLLEDGSRQIEVRVDERLEPSYMDREKIYRVFLNLIENAIKFSSQGEIRVEANLADGQVEGRVRDRGIGIPRDKLSEIFEAFHQVDSSPTRPYQGVGLGLAICRQLVEMHGGRIWAESQPESGTQLTFRIPYHREPPEAETVEPPAATAPAERR